MSNTYKIAVDGPAGSGKSSISKKIAASLGIKYIDSGAIYRTITFFFMGPDGTIESSPDVRALVSAEITQKFLESGKSATFLNGEDISEKIRSEQVVKNISTISDNREIREYVNVLLRKWAEAEPVIMDGRDIGTVVFPDADVKLFLDASVDVRAERRVGEYRDLGKTVDLNEIKTQIIIRDEQDRSRAFGALTQAADAVYVDTSRMTKDEVIAAVIEIISKKLMK